MYTPYFQKGQILHFSSTADLFFLTLPPEFLTTPCFLSHPMVPRSPLFVPRSSLSSIRVKAKVGACVCKFPGHEPGCSKALLVPVLQPVRLLSVNPFFEHKEASHLKSWVWHCWRRQAGVFRVGGRFKVGGRVEGGARSGGWKGLVGKSGQECRWAARPTPDSWPVQPGYSCPVQPNATLLPLPLQPSLFRVSGCSQGPGSRAPQIKEWL